MLTPLPDFPEEKKDLQHGLKLLEQELTLSDNKLRDILHRFLHEFNKGLSTVATPDTPGQFLPQM